LRDIFPRFQIWVELVGIGQQAGLLIFLKGLSCLIEVQMGYRSRIVQGGWETTKKSEDKYKRGKVRQVKTVNEYCINYTVLALVS